MLRSLGLTLQRLLLFAVRSARPGVKGVMVGRGWCPAVLADVVPVRVPACLSVPSAPVQPGVATLTWLGTPPRLEHRSSSTVEFGAPG
jgi:hypothetical protein